MDKFSRLKIIIADADHIITLLRAVFLDLSERRAEDASCERFPEDHIVRLIVRGLHRVGLHLEFVLGRDDPHVRCQTNGMRDSEFFFCREGILFPDFLPVASVVVVSSSVGACGASFAQETAKSIARTIANMVILFSSYPPFHSEKETIPTESIYPPKKITKKDAHASSWFLKSCRGLLCHGSRFIGRDGHGLVVLVRFVVDYGVGIVGEEFDGGDVLRRGDAIGFFSPTSRM